MAKLDFFVRYPDFFAKVEPPTPLADPTVQSARDSSMIRHHYGPWDQRYYAVLAYLEARHLLTVERRKRTYIFALTDTGRALAATLEQHSAFSDLVGQMQRVAKRFRGESGEAIKKLIYKVFDTEVADLAKGEVIR